MVGKKKTFIKLYFILPALDKIGSIMFCYLILYLIFVENFQKVNDKTLFRNIMS